MSGLWMRTDLARGSYNLETLLEHEVEEKKEEKREERGECRCRGEEKPLYWPSMDPPSASRSTGNNLMIHAFFLNGSNKIG
jgi:hypothetical protein